MKAGSILVLTLLSLLMTPLTFAQIGQERSEQEDLQEKMVDGLNSFLVDDFFERKKDLGNYASLADQFTDAKDREDYLEFVTGIKGANKFAVGKVSKGVYQVQVEGILISVPLVNLFSSRIVFNDKIFPLQAGESFSAMRARLGQFIEKEFLTENFSKTSTLLDFFMASAHAKVSAAQREKLKNILEVNATGAVYLSLSNWQIWRKDSETFQKLLFVIAADMTEVNATCQQLSQKVGVLDQGSGVKVFGLLNDSTSETLERLSSNDKVNSRLVLRNALSAYARPSKHTEKDDGAMDCRQFFGGVSSLIGGTIRTDIDQTCQAFDQAVSCLEDLKNNHDKVYARGRNNTLKLLNGKRSYSDNNQDAFESLNPSRGTSR